MSTLFGLPTWLFGLSVAGATLAVLYFVYRGLRRDHAIGRYHFTWGIGIGLLFLWGFVPGLVGVGLYLAVERGYPPHWLLAYALVGAVVFVLVLYGIMVAAGTGVS